MSKQKNNVNDLLAAIKRQPTNPTPEIVPADSVPKTMPGPSETTKQQTTSKKPTTEKKPPSRVGKPVQFWMHAEDKQLIRELSAWLAGQGLRPTDSMVIRAVLRLAKAGNGLLEAYWEAAKLDGRLKRD